MLPDFLIIGAQRCGTTLLYDLLCQHPHVIPASQKEVHFFDIRFQKGVDWYESFFKEVEDKKNQTKSCLTGEATPYYLFNPLVPERSFKLIPKTKLIVLLRNPIDRAFSHYQLEIRLGNEELTFEDAINNEEKRLGNEEQKFLKNENYTSFNHQHFSYLNRGIYVDQLQKWEKFFPKKQFFIIQSEQFFSEPNKILKQLFEFLELPHFDKITFDRPKKEYNTKMNSEARKKLFEYYVDYNERLYEFLQKRFNWNN